MIDKKDIGKGLWVNLVTGEKAEVLRLFDNGGIEWVSFRAYIGAIPEIRNSSLSEFAELCKEALYVPRKNLPLFVPLPPVLALVEKLSLEDQQRIEMVKQDEYIDSVIIDSLVRRMNFFNKISYGPRETFESFIATVNIVIQVFAYCDSGQKAQEVYNNSKLVGLVNRSVGRNRFPNEVKNKLRDVFLRVDEQYGRLLDPVDSREAGGKSKKEVRKKARLAVAYIEQMIIRIRAV